MDCHRPAATHTVTAVLLSVILLPALAPAQPPYPKSEEQPVRRRDSHLGLGIGYAGTSSVVHEVFGEGTDALLYLNQRLYKFLGLRASFGSVYLGSTEPEAEGDTYITGFEFFGASFSNFTMKYTYVTVGPSIQLHLFSNHSILASGSYVFYDVILDLASLEAHKLEVKNDRRGFNADLMYTYWIGDSWGFNAQFQWHWVDTTSDGDDLYNVFVRGDSDPQFVSFLIGAQIGYR